MIIKANNNTLVVYLDGDVDQHKVSNIKSMVDKAIIENNTKNIIFDFTKVDFMDSSGIGMVLSRYKTLENTSGEIALCGVSENTMKLFDMVGIKKIIKIYNTIEECLMNF